MHRRTDAQTHLWRATNQVFLYGPRKYCSGVFTNGPQRACIGLAYWALIFLTIFLCFLPAQPVVIILSLVVQKLVWGLNLAASCGCLPGATAAARSSADTSGARAQTAPGHRVDTEVVSRSAL